MPANLALQTLSLMQRHHYSAHLDSSQQRHVCQAAQLSKGWQTLHGVDLRQPVTRLVARFGGNIKTQIARHGGNSGKAEGRQDSLETAAHRTVCTEIPERFCVFLEAHST